MKYALLFIVIVGMMAGCKNEPRFTVDQSVIKMSWGYRVVTDVWDTQDDDRVSGRTIVRQFDLSAEQATDSAKKSDLAKAQQIADQLNKVK